MDEMLLRGCTLRNSGYAVGVVGEENVCESTVFAHHLTVHFIAIKLTSAMCDYLTY
jgi:hypothetical protein